MSRPLQVKNSLPMTDNQKQLKFQDKIQNIN